MKKSPLLLITTALLAAPSLLLAQAPNLNTGFGTLGGLINDFSKNVITAAGTLLMASAVVVFFYGIVRYIIGKQEGSADKVKAGGSFMAWSLVALFVMFSVYGIVKYGQDIIFGKGADVTTISIPEIKFQKGGSTTPTPSPLGGGLCPCPNNDSSKYICGQNPATSCPQ